MEHYNEQGLAICQVCGKSFHKITAQHLEKLHNINMTEYKQKFEGAPLVSNQLRAKLKFTRTNLFKENEIKEDVVKKDEIKDENKNSEEDKITEEIKIEERDEIDLEKIPVVSKDFSKTVSNFIEEVKNFTKNQQELKFVDPTNTIHRDKLRILNFLINFFPDVKNSFFIEKTNISNHLEYRLVTDICVPSLKIDFEFPQTFWHNHDMPKASRDFILKRDGWAIIDIPGAKPSNTEIKDTLKKIKLI